MLAPAAVFLAGSGALAAEPGLVSGAMREAIPPVWYLAPVGALVGLIAAWACYRGVMRADEGTDEMRSIAAHVREGAMAYLKQQYKVVGLFIVLAAIIFVVMSFVLKVQSRVVPFAFLTGAVCSGLAGYLGMRTATNASARTANAARTSLDGGLRVAFRAGAVMGLSVVGLALLPMSIWFFALYTFSGPEFDLAKITMAMIGFGIGASTQALFARVGGGIYTKAADVGADLVGKVEAGIPEDDPRNPATIADNVGDNVGDVAGMGADLYESYCGSILASAALAVAAGLGMAGAVLPAVLAGIGIVLSVLGVFVVRTREGADQKGLLKALNRGTNLSSVLILAASGALCYLLLKDNAALPAAGVAWWGPWGSIVVGLIVGIIIGTATEHYTSDAFGPTRGIAAQSSTGPATVIIEGLAVGMKSTWVPAIAVAVGTMTAFGLAGGFQNAPLGLFGVGVAAVGMLSTLGITLATDAYGPVADNAGANAEMAGLDPVVRERTDALDALGNTTAAKGKGFAIGSAALTALALMSSYIEEVHQGVQRTLLGAREALIGGIAYTPQALSDAIERAGGKLAFYMQQYDVTLLNPRVLAGMLVGSMMAFLFCSFTMKAVGRCAADMVEEVRRQFREIAGLMERKAKPDYARCVAISTRGAQRQMIVPSLMAIVVPIIVGLLLGVPGVLGLLAGALAAGFVLAVMMANAGGAWDNAKKYIEKGAHGGKGSDAHKAAVVGDTVGDPFKDTAGPSLNIMIKLMSMVSVVFAGLVVRYAPEIARWLHIG